MNSRRAGVAVIVFIAVLLFVWLFSTYVPAGTSGAQPGAPVSHQ